MLQLTLAAIAVHLFLQVFKANGFYTGKDKLFQTDAEAIPAMQAAVAVIAGAATYMQRRTPSGDAFGGSSGSSLAAPFAAVGGAFGWIKNKIPGESRNVCWCTHS